ncbi:MAG: response regulator, partial [Phycisphaerales bacterium]|nr:response regulator [Phycisphaerales bacterium]
VEHRVLAVEAVVAARSSARPFDLVLMDIQMREMDGLQSTRRLRDQGVGLPIIALTAHALDTLRRECRAAGFVDYLTKPVQSERLCRACARWARPDRRTVA